MQVTRSQIIARGLTNCCPNCGGRTLFKAGTLFQVNKECPACGLKIERTNQVEEQEGVTKVTLSAKRI